MKKLYLLFFTVVLIIAVPSVAFSANARFSVSLAADTSITMDSTSGSLSVTVTNTSNQNKRLKFVRFEVNNSVYNFSSANAPPLGSGWMIKEIDNAFAPGIAMIEFAAERVNAELTKGDSQTFDIILTGASGAPITQDSSDQTDAFTNVRVWERASPPPPGLYGDEATRDGAIPTWIRRGLKCEFFVSPNALPVNDTMTVNISVVNASSAIQSNIRVINFLKQGTGNVALVSGPDPNRLTLAPGETGEIAAVFRATRIGNVIMSIDMTNGTVSSDKTYSNEINIGFFIATLTVSPEDVANGNNVTLMMAVTNTHDTVSAHNIVPSTPQFSGNASADLIDGPNPPSLSVLSPGETFYYFTWTYEITGDAGDDYTFSAYADNDENYPSNTAESNTGIISVFAFSVTPVSINSGSINQDFVFNIQNGGKPKIKVESVEIFHPTTDFIYGSASGGYGGNWTVTSLADRIRFDAPDEAQYLPGGEQMDLTVTYSQTPTVVSTMDYNFDSLIHGSRKISVFGFNSKFDFTESKSKTIYITNTVMELEYSPQDLSADGNAETTITLTLLDGDIAMPNRPIDFQFVFTGSYEGNPFWTYEDSLTDDQGEARARFRAPYNATDCSVIVKGVYGTTEKTIEIPFVGYDKPNVLYSGNLDPAAVWPGEGIPMQVTLDVRNTSESNDMNLTTGSYFRVNDASLGGTTEYIAYLASSTSVPAGESIITLTFESKVFPTSFMFGQFNPELFLTDGNPDNDQTREVSDELTVGTGDSGIRIIDWRIKR